MDLSFLYVCLVQTLGEIDGIEHAPTSQVTGGRTNSGALGNLVQCLFFLCSFSELTEWSTSCKEVNIYAGTMLSISGTTTKMNINSKVYSGVYGDTSKCYGDTSTCCHGDTSRSLADHESYFITLVVRQ